MSVPVHVVCGPDDAHDGVPRGGEAECRREKKVGLGLPGQAGCGLDRKRGRRRAERRERSAAGRRAGGEDRETDDGHAAEDHCTMTRASRVAFW